MAKGDERNLLENFHKEVRNIFEPVISFVEEKAQGEWTKSRIMMENLILINILDGELKLTTYITKTK